MNIYFTSLTKIIFNISILGIVCVLAFYYRHELQELYLPTKPCTEPITYSLGEFDTRFGIDKDDFLTITQEAEAVWEDALGKELFNYASNGDLKVHLIYDYRQETTDTLQNIDGLIQKDQQAYNTLKETYTDLKRTYDLKTRIYEAELEAYERGELNSKKEVDDLNRKGKELNTLGSEINTVTKKLNALAEKLNIKVDNFNTVGAGIEDEFNEGEYIRDEQGERIQVYQFENTAALKRLLQHELGHALGLDHVNDQEAIMYHLNISTNSEITTADLNELTRVCTE